jgi:Tfp pilus assembly protein PilF
MSIRAASIALAIILSLLPLDAGSIGLDETYIKASNQTSWSERFNSWYKSDEFEKSYAVIIGIGDYDKYPKLQAPALDAIRVRDFLRDEANFDYIVTLTNEKATRNRIESLMEYELPQLIKPKDRLIFYFSGHGDTRDFGSDEKRGYLVLKSSGRKRWDEMIDMPRLRQWAQNVGHARHSLFLLDACFSGLSAFQPKSVLRDMTIARLIQPGHRIVTAGMQGEESYAVDGQSLFTSGFLNAARGADYTGEGIVSLTEIMTYINQFLDSKRAELGLNLKMTPQQWSTRFENNGGEFFFLRPAFDAVQSSSISSKEPPAFEKKGDSSGGLSANPGDAAFEQGIAYQARGNLDQAIASFNEAIRLDPKHIFAWAYRGEAHRLKSQFDQSISSFNEAIRLSPEYVLAWAHRGEAYRIKGDLDQAIASFNEAIRLDPKYVFAWAHRGEAYRAKGLPGRAVSDFDQAIRLNPTYAWIWNSRAEAYRIKGEFNRAIAEFDEEMRFGPKLHAEASR